MTIYLLDYKLNSSGWKACFERCLNLSATNDDDFSLPDPAPAGEVIVFLHTETESVKEYWLGLLQNSKVSAVVLINSGGKSRLTGDPPDGAHACFWDPTKFGSESRPKKLAEQITGGDFKAIEWDLLQPENSEAILAARIIAAAAAGGGNTCGLETHSPGQKLAAAAKAVVDAEANSQALATAISSLNSLLGVKD